MPRLPHPRTSLSGYVDARLSPWRRVLVEHHLHGCTRCAVEVAQVRALHDVLRGAPPPEVPPHLVDRLLALGGEAAGRETGADGPVAGEAGAAAGAAGPEAVAAGAETGPGVPVVPGPREEDGAPAGVGAAGVLVASVLVLGAVVAGSTATGVPLPWPSATSRASIGSVLPRLWSDVREVPDGSGAGEHAPDGAGPVQPVDNGPRP